MQNDYQNELHQIVLEFQQVLFPSYPFGCSSEQAIERYEPLKQYLLSIDNARNSHQITAQMKECLLNQLIKLMNQACSYTHREEISKYLLKLVADMERNLANLPIGKMCINISEWDSQIPVPKLTDYKKQISNCVLQKNITILLDKLYQQNRRIPHLEHLLLNFPQTLLIKQQFQQCLFENPQSTIPLTQKIYLGIIAASTFGCRYLWNNLVKKYLRCGGSIQWISQGINSCPKHIKKLGQLSWLLAYNFNEILQQDVFKNAISEHIVQQFFMIEGLYIISYYQQLACLCLVTGLQSQTQQLLDVYLPAQKFLKPSPESFEAMLYKELKQQIQEEEKALDNIDTFMLTEQQQTPNVIPANRIKKNWFNSDQQEDQPNHFNSFQSQQNLNSDQEQYKKENSLPKLIYQEAQYQKLKNMKTLTNVQNIFNKYTHFGKLNSNQISNKKLLKHNHQLLLSGKDIVQIKDETVYASNWSFKVDTIQELDNHLHNGFSKKLQKYLSSFRMPRLSEQDKINNQKKYGQLANEHQKSKNIQIYYEMLNNYLYECVDYPKLIQKNVTTIQKNFIKLITKSPFLFNQRSFAKMRNQLELSPKNMLKQIMQIVSYKFQLNINIIVMMYSRLKNSSIEE